MSALACESDRYRRLGAADHLSEQRGEFERRLEIVPGYDHRAMGCGHGQHGMDWRFLLIGPKGATVFLVFVTGFTPGRLSITGNLPPCNLGCAMAADLGSHWRTPRYPDEQPSGRCEYLGGAPCYYDGSGLRAGPVFESFLHGGLPAVWGALEDEYRAQAGDQ